MQESYVQNRSKTRDIRITVETSWTYGIKRGKPHRVIQVPAGGRRSLGCNQSAVIPVTHRKFKVLGVGVS